ncbi:MAG: class II fructose-bisphosphate aldolase [Kordiimonadaceae bacterium]|nr:class II fructose-bisphosphate aldolase [Kordiimonadaceae bacterium]MBO6567645.1 class II fructose-bisphosphate aldolase [Kordiimonadaceae bacterium]MBO6963141.1 class II fructose-bisphosphate aldolase [Kordiimonadaceae bacterium]
MKPGVVFGDDYAKLVEACKEGGYALPAVNVVGTSSLNAVMEAAAKNRSDVIIQFSNSGAQFYAGKGMEDAFRAKVLGAVSAAKHVQLLAEHYGICVVLHTDHANRKLVPWVEALVEESRQNIKREGVPLYSSHMLDLSEEPIGDNLETCARVLKEMTPLGMSLEIELGVTGGEEDGVGSDVDDDFENPSLYTQPEDVLQAYDLLTPLGHFSVAASFGNVHGVYKPGNVKLRPEILQASQAMVEKERSTSANPLHFVFHGGSGSEKAKIEEALEYGVFKMNIDTDTQFAFAEAVGTYVNENQNAFKWQVHPDDGTPYKKQYDPRVWLRAAEQSMVSRLDEAFVDLKSKGRTVAG